MSHFCFDSWFAPDLRRLPSSARRAPSLLAFFLLPPHCLAGRRLGLAARPHPQKLCGSCGGMPQRTVMGKRKRQTATGCNYCRRAAVAKLREVGGSSAGAEGCSVSVHINGVDAGDAHLQQQIFSFQKEFFLYFIFLPFW